MATLGEVDHFAGFFGMLGCKLEPFQRKIVEEVFSPRRETLILLPRANGKSTLLAGIGLWSLLRGKGSQIVVGAASREQAATLPASWLTPEGLAEQNDAVHELAWQRYHLNVWTGGEAPWILPDEWDRTRVSPRSRARVTR